MCFHLFAVLSVFSAVLHAVLCSFRQLRDENAQTEQDGLMWERENGRRLTPTKKEREGWVRDGTALGE